MNPTGCGGRTPGAGRQGHHAVEQHGRFDRAVQEVLRLGARVIPAHADRQPGRWCARKDGFIVHVVSGKDGAGGTASSHERPHRVCLVGRQSRDHVDDELAAKDPQGIVAVCQHLGDDLQSVLTRSRQAVVQCQRMPLVLDGHTSGFQRWQAVEQTRPDAGHCFGRLAGGAGIACTFGTMVAHDEAGFETESTADVLDAAAGHDRQRKVGRQRGQACRDAFRQARIVGTRHDGGERAVEVEGQQRPLLQRSGQCAFAFRAEQVLHRHRGRRHVRVIEPGDSAHAPRCVRAAATGRRPPACGRPSEIR